ncbi:MAG: hypothetical protein IBX39_09195 [Candidatus Methanoperedenaceae archaeon]|nr:hypothetical protein [Candidatus Methanoperedenaceae archaeon]
MAKYRFEVVLEYPDDMHPEDILDLVQENTGGKVLRMTVNNPKRMQIEIVIDLLKETLERCGFKSFGTICGINENRSYTHFLRNKEHISIEVAPEEEPDVLEALTDEQEETSSQEEK